MAVSAASILLFTACGTAAPSSVGDASTPSSENAPSGDTSETTPESTDETTPESTEAEPVTIVPELLKSYEFTVEDIVIALPIKYMDFEALGFVPDEEDIQEECLPNSMGLLIRTTRNGYPVYISCDTYGTEPVSYKDTLITGFSSTETYASDGGDANVTLPGGLKLWESTADDALKLYGEPTKRTDNASEDNFIYTIEDDFETKPPTNCEYQLSFRKESGMFCGFDLLVRKPMD